MNQNVLVRPVRPPISKLMLAAIASFLWPSLPPTAMATEEPQYSVILANEDFEIRRYDPFIVAETVVEAASLESGSSEGFRRLAGYIFGGNRSKESISMTAPVSTARSEKIAMTAPVESHMAGRDLVMTFMMPSEYSLERLPEPNDSRVVLKQLPGRTMGAIKFSGSWSEERFREHTEMLLNWLNGLDIRTVGVPAVARYDPPWTPWFMRRNEILVEVVYPARESSQSTATEEISLTRQ